VFYFVVDTYLLHYLKVTEFKINKIFVGLYYK